MAGRSPHHVQPRVGTARRLAVERAEKTSLVGRGETRVDRARCSRLHARRKRPITGRRKMREGDEALARRRAVHHARRRRRLDMGADGTARRSAADALRAARIARSPTRSIRRTRANPPADKKERAGNAYVPIGDARFPHVLTTYRLTEHHTAGGMSRYLSHLSELQPQFFAEISPDLAREVGVAQSRLGHHRLSARHRRSACARDVAHAVADASTAA